MKNKLIFFSFILLFCSSLAMASGIDVVGVQQSLGNFPQGECVTLKQLCGNCTTVGITSVVVTGTTQTQVLGNVTMVQTGTEWNYVFCNTTMLGRYIVSGYGNPLGITEPFAYDFNISSTGNLNMEYVLPAALLIIAIILLVITFTIKNEFIGFIAGAITAVDGVYIMIYGLGNFANLYTQAISYILIGFGAFILIASAYEAITSNQVNLIGRDEDED